MSDNLIDELNSDSKYKSSFNSDYILSQSAQQDNDSTSSFLNLIDQELLTTNQISGDNYSPSYALSESTNNSSNEQLAKPDVKGSGLDPTFEDILLSKLPQIVAIERASIQFQVTDQTYPSLSKSFQNCFNSPVLDLLVVVLDKNKYVTLFQGYFAGTPRLTNELIDLTGRHWKTFISNNDENAWENHFKSVDDKHNSKKNYDLEFELGPVIRCQLRSSSNPQYNQQFNYFFVQPCSYIIELPSNNYHVISPDFNSLDTNSVGRSNYFVSYINIVRECDTEYALKGSAAASLQKVITNSTYVQRQKLDSILDTPPNKHANNRYFRRNVHNIPPAINNQLSVNISSPAYSNIEQSPIPVSTPLTYPLINNHRSDQYNKSSLFTGAPIQHQMSQQRQLSMSMNPNLYMNRNPSLSNVDPNQHRYSGPYENSSLQYILENRNNNYQNVKQIPNQTHLMGQHGQIYKNQIQSNHAYFIPTAQSTQQNCSLNSPSSFMPARHVIQMPSNNIIMSSDPYFRGSHQINMMDSVQTAQPMMTVVQPMSANSNHSSANYYYSTAQNQILHNQLHINTAMTNQSQFVSSSVSPYCNSERAPGTHQEYTGTSSRTNRHASIKEETYDICQNDWLSNSLLDSRNSSMMSKDSNEMMTIDIVEEILQAEEAKSENISLEHESIKSDSSESLMGYLNDFVSNTNKTTSISTPSVQISVPSPKLLNLDCVKSEGKVSDLKSHKYQSSKTNINSQMITSNANLKAEILKNLDSSQRLRIKKIVYQYKTGKIKKYQMCQQINHFLSQALGSQTYSQHVIKFWNTHQNLNDNVDSTLSGFNYSHVVQSPEEGPGISPTEQAAQSTTDLEEDKEIIKHSAKVQSNRCMDKANIESNKRLVRCKSNNKNSEASIYSITSTTSTGVLETLLNEHDNHTISEKSLNTVIGNNIVNSKLPISSTSKNQLSLDQLLLDDELPMFPNVDEKLPKKTSESVSMRNMNSKMNKSQPSTPLVSNNMGVLEALLNQKTPSVLNLRQMSTESILKHSKPSRQNSSEMFMDDSNNSFESFDKDKEKNLKKNSLLITLLNTSQNSDKGKLLNSSVSLDESTPNIQAKRCRMLSGSQSFFDSTVSSKKTEDKLISPGVDVFDFVDNEFSYCTTDSTTQSTVVTSSQPLNVRKKGQAKRGRKRRYSKDRSIDSDESSDRLSSIGEKYMKTSSINTKLEDKNVILTSLLENKKPRDMTPVTPGKGSLNIEKTDNDYTQQTMIYDNQIVADDNIDLEDIKIDDFDLENLIDLSENYDDSAAPVLMEISEQPMSVTVSQLTSEANMVVNKPNVINSTMSSTSYDSTMPPVYKMVGPVIKSDPIVPMSKQSIIRVSDKNSILLSAIQSTSTTNSISFECLDSERERLLRQQQQQKVCMGGDKPPVTMSHHLSLDMLSKQMKEVGPNVMVELSIPSDLPRSRKCSISKSHSGISSLSSCNPPSTISTSPTCRSSYQPSCTVDNSSDSGKLAHTTVNHVNHQQVREGLRLLVSSRSAQNITKNNNQMHRSNPNDVMTHSEPNSIPKSSVKDVIHYTPTLQSSNPRKDSSYTYPTQSYISSLSMGNDSKTADILEDSLVNDVFGLEELVNSKSRHSSATNEYSRLNLQESFNETQTESSLFSSGGNLQNVPGNTFSHSKPPHHHHHHTHHYHHHHHHHPVSNPPSVNDSNITTTKEKQSVNSGLLETLLSR